MSENVLPSDLSLSEFEDFLKGYSERTHGLFLRGKKIEDSISEASHYVNSSDDYRPPQDKEKEIMGFFQGLEQDDRLIAFWIIEVNWYWCTQMFMDLGIIFTPQRLLTNEIKRCNLIQKDINKLRNSIRKWILEKPCLDYINYNDISYSGTYVNEDYLKLLLAMLPFEGIAGAYFSYMYDAYINIEVYSIAHEIYDIHKDELNEIPSSLFDVPVRFGLFNKLIEYAKLQNVSDNLLGRVTNALGTILELENLYDIDDIQ